MTKFRNECDSIGMRQVPLNAYYGVQSLRAAENFRITGTMAHSEMIKAIAQVKMAAAVANKRVGTIDEKIASAVIQACKEVLDGKFNEYFIVDQIQGGAGTSFNMNANEVIANRAIELLGGTLGDYSIVHPNDHINCSQSTNDAYPTAGRIATVRLLKKASEELEMLYNAFMKKAADYNDVIKMGRTEMQDAVPVSFGQVFRAYASAIKRSKQRLTLAIDEMSIINMGATAIGTGINADVEYIKTIVPILAEITGLPLKQADDLIDATQNLDSFVYVSGIIKSCAVTLSKIANDLRLMSSGPRTGLSEINLAPKQNGSSIMPGKINPVIPEVMNQICFNIMGNDTTVTYASESGQLELNAFEPIIFRCLFESIDTLSNGVKIFTEECVNEITVNSAQCKTHLDRSIGMITSLCPYIGYARASFFAKKALAENKNIRDVLIQEGVMPAEQIDKLLDPASMI